MENEHDIDRLFKRGLSDPEIPFNEFDWKKMERKLDAQKKKRIIPLWMFTGIGLAASLLVFLIWFFDTPAPIQRVNKNRLTERYPKPKSHQRDTAAKTKPESLLAENDQNSLPQPAERSAEVYKLSPDWILPDLKPVPLVAQRSPKKAYIPTYDGAAGKTIAETDSAMLVRKANALAQSKDPFERVGAAEIVRSVQKNMDNTLTQNHDLILSAMAAPDISTAKSSKPSKVSSNVGLLATYALGHKFSVTSGAVYAKKYYNSGGTATQANTYTTTDNAWEVKADCNVLDIPLNVNYKLLQKKKLSVSVNTGLSSYFMLKEKYEFVTGQPGPAQQVSTLEINNQNQHLFGIANVSVSFDHQISQSISVGVQPFAKLPLTGIGYGNASLKSAGVSFSLNIELFPAKKPGKYAANRYTYSQND